jgi:hypothetical protein
LREELERIKTIKSRNYSPAKFNDIRLENKTQITSELEKLVIENDRLKELVFFYKLQYYLIFSMHL